MSVGGYVGACSAAEGEGPGRAGFLKKFQFLSQVLSQFLFQFPGRGRLLFENASLVDFPIVNEQKRRKRAAFSRVSYWKSDDWPTFKKRKRWRQSGRRFDFLYTKNFGRAGIRFSLHKEFPRGRDRLLSAQRIPRGREPIFAPERIS